MLAVYWIFCPDLGLNLRVRIRVIADHDNFNMSRKVFPFPRQLEDATHTGYAGKSSFQYLAVQDAALRPLELLRYYQYETFIWST